MAKHTIDETYEAVVEVREQLKTMNGTVRKNCMDIAQLQERDINRNLQEVEHNRRMTDLGSVMQAGFNDAKAVAEKNSGRGYEQDNRLTVLEGETKRQGTSWDRVLNMIVAVAQAVVIAYILSSR